MPVPETIIRSEEVREVLGKIPPRILRYGIIVLGAFLCALLALSYFIKYPDLVEAPAVIISSPAPVNLLAKQEGLMGAIFSHSGDTVREGQLLATLRSNANMAHIDQLKHLLAGRWDYRRLLDTLESRRLLLGEVQSQYNVLLIALEDYKQSTDPAVEKEIAFQSARRASLSRLERAQEMLCSSLSTEYAIAGRQHARDSLLFAQGVLAPEAYDGRARAYLQSQLRLMQERMALQKIRLDITDAENTLLQKRSRAAQLVEEKRSNVAQALRLLGEALWTWQERYALQSPIEGVVNSAKFWQAGQSVGPGELIYTVVPLCPARLQVQVRLPAKNLGKVHVGQEVFITLHAYPEQEFGRLKGRLSYLSSTPNAEGVFVSSVYLPQGLRTTYGIALPASPHLTGIATIITQDLRLIERLLLPVKHQISKHLP